MSSRRDVGARIFIDDPLGGDRSRFSMVSQRRQNLVGTLSTWSIFALSLIPTLASCSPGEMPRSTASFARTSATIVQPTNATYPINLIFVAEPDDAIWTDLTGIVLSDDLSVPPGDFTVARGDDANGVTLGNVTFTVAIPPTGLSFHTVGLVFGGSSTIVQVPVGGWLLTSAPADDFASEDARADVVGMPRCTTADFPVPKAVASVQRFDPGSTDVRADEVSLDTRSHTVTAELACGGDFDFRVMSPSIDYTDDSGKTRTARLAPVSIGFQDVTDADLQRIASR
ncbi:MULTISPECIES: hypothetical protein [Microbacterium]|uniref:hypothetical protein n=1 Tax=Microbacterium TaxID=33882 RepID=UPI0028E4F3F7|nr:MULTISPECIES: hypothetical protein [Microbacterium]